MVDTLLEQMKEKLDRAMGRFLAPIRGCQQPHCLVINQMMERGWDMCIFGGAIRNMLTRGPDAPMRDVDIVVAEVESDEIARVFATYVRGRTKFGGYKLCVDGANIDIWALHDTWAFQSRGARDASFAELPRTTFLTTDAIIVRLISESSQWEVIEHGFFDSLASRTIEVNLPINPFPSLSVIRALVMSCQLNFSLGPRLLECIDRWTREITATDVARAQQEHYGVSVLSDLEITDALNRIRLHRQANRIANLELGFQERSQLMRAGRQ